MLGLEAEEVFTAGTELTKEMRCRRSRHAEELGHLLDRELGPGEVVGGTIINADEEALHARVEVDLDPLQWLEQRLPPRRLLHLGGEGVEVSDHLLQTRRHCG